MTSGALQATGELPEVEWQRTFGGPGNDLSNFVRQTADGGYVVAARTQSSPGEPFDALLVRLDARGALAWERRLGGPGEDLARSVQEVPGGFVAAGSSDGRIALWKTDTEGTLEWHRLHGGELGGTAYSVDRTRDGGLVLTGAAGGDLYLARTGSGGDLLWETFLGGDGTEVGASVVETLDGGFAVTGWTSSFGAGETDVYLLKTDGAGELLWHRTFGGGEVDWGESVVETPEGDYVLAGSRDDEVFLARTDASGNTLWESFLGGIEANAVSRSRGGGFVVGGLSATSRGDGTVVYVVKATEGGDLEWAVSFEETGIGWSSSIQQTRDEGFIVCGSSRQRGESFFDVLVLKLGEEMPPTVAFRRGDTGGDGVLDLSDAVFILNFLFLGGPLPACEDAADTDDDGSWNITDAVFLLGFLFLGSSPPPPRFPEPGLDPTADRLGCGVDDRRLGIDVE
ncbi:MAG: hypothetical protein O7J95_16150 [Planctomycetota bacterium]|nr:hypothetical protein [Planctomycetota bacterium]